MSDGQKQLLTLALILGGVVLLCAGFVVGAVQLTGGVAELVNPTPPSPAPSDGVLITAVLPNSPAAQANLQPGHIILRLDDQPITSPDLLVLLLANMTAGTEFNLLLRDEAGTLRQTAAVRAAESPYLGVEIVDLPVQTPKATVVNPTPPVTPPIVTQLPVITGIVPDSPAANVDVQVGDIVTAVNGQVILSGEELLMQMAEKLPGESVRFTLRRGKETLQRTTVLVPHPEDSQRGFLGIEFQP